MQKVQLYFKYVILAFFTFLFFLIISPFLPAIVFAVVFAIIFNPIYEYLKDKLKWPETLSAVLVVLMTIIFILTPLVILLGLITQETINFATTFDVNGFYEVLTKYSNMDVLGYRLDIMQYTESFVEVMKNAGLVMSAYAGLILGTLTGTAFLFFVFLFVYFFFLRDGHLLVKKCRAILPFTNAQNKKLFNDFYNTSKTVFVGYIIAAGLSGVIAYVAFTIFGVPGAIIWALLTSLLSLVPKIGTIVVYGTGAIIVGLMSGIWAALGLLVYFIIFEVVGMWMVIRPKLVDEKISMHPVFVFFSLVGGITVFGSVGIIYGPLIMVMFVSIFDFIVGTSHAIKE